MYIIHRTWYTRTHTLILRLLTLCIYNKYTFTPILCIFLRIIMYMYTLVFICLCKIFIVTCTWTYIVIIITTKTAWIVQA